jgi:hypothetical protein
MYVFIPVFTYMCVINVYITTVATACVTYV